MSNFKLDKKGVWYLPKQKNDEPIPPEFICSPIEIIAITKNENNENFGRLLKITDPDGNTHFWAMPMKMLAGDGSIYREILLDKGVIIAPGHNIRNLLTIYLQSSLPTKRICCVSKTGWVENTFIFPDESFSENDELEFVYQTEGFLQPIFESKGSLKEWQDNVASLCIDNSRLIFSVSCAFAAPLLYLLKIENGGFHFRGPSSCGKTTLLNAATSVYGSKRFFKTWRTTDNALESIAMQHNDSLLVLDEISQVDPKVAGEIAYMLANGSGKSRANKYGNAKERYLWRNLFLSTGEISLATHIKQKGAKIRVGQEIRIIDIPVDTNQYGAFDNILGYKNGSEYSDIIKTNSNKLYGTAGKFFIKDLVKNKDKATKRVLELKKDFIEKISLSNQTGQTNRVIQRFALVAAAGQYATEIGITGWFEDDVLWAIKNCFEAWFNINGFSSYKEEKQLISETKLFFEKHASSRFASNNPEDQIKIINRAGIVKNTSNGPIFCVFQEVFKEEICEGRDYKFAAKIFVEKDWLITDSEGGPTKPERIPGFEKPIRCYCFDGQKIFADD